MSYLECLTNQIGSRICKSAVSRGWDVTSISRSGEPVWSSVTSSADAPPWSSSVSWQKADILKPASYKPMLKDAEAVVHSMGILLEADYKGVLTGKESIWGGLSRAFSATKGGSQNPLERKEGEELVPQEEDGQLTYELMNRDTGTFSYNHAKRMTRGRMLIKLSRSNHTSSGSGRSESPFLRLYICGGGNSHTTQKIHHYQKRCRVYYCVVVP